MTSDKDNLLLRPELGHYLPLLVPVFGFLKILNRIQEASIPPPGAAVFSYFEPHQIRVLSPAINFLKTEFRGHLDLGIPCQKHRGRHRDNSNTITPDLRILKKLVKSR